MNQIYELDGLIDEIEKLFDTAIERLTAGGNCRPKIIQIIEIVRLSFCLEKALTEEATMFQIEMHVELYEKLKTMLRETLESDFVTPLDMVTHKYWFQYYVKVFNSPNISNLKARRKETLF